MNPLLGAPIARKLANQPPSNTESDDTRVGVVTLRGHDIDGLVQERRESITNPLELRFPCTTPSTW